MARPLVDEAQVASPDGGAVQAEVAPARPTMLGHAASQIGAPLLQRKLARRLAARRAASQDSQSAAASSSGDGAAKQGAGEVRATTDHHNEGAGPGVQRGGAGKRKLGIISGSTFVPQEPSAAEAQAAPAPGGAAPAHDGERAFFEDRRQADSTAQDGKTQIKITDEQPAQVSVIVAAVARARELVDNALAQLGNPKDVKVASALQANFHGTENKTIAEVRRVLGKVKSAFSGTIPIEVEDDGTARAYVYVLWSNIHLCPPWFADNDPEGRARTIVHECTHKYAGTDDKAYHWDPKFQTLGTKDALNNADSHAWFCIDVR